MPGGRDGAGFGFAVADETAGDEVGVVEDGSKSDGKAVSELASFQDGAWGRGVGVAWVAVGGGESFTDFFESFFVEGDCFGVIFGEGSFEEKVGLHGWESVSGTDDDEYLGFVFYNQAVDVCVDKINSWAGAPVAEKSWFDVDLFEFVLKQNVVLKVDLCGGEVVGGSDEFFEGVDFGGIDFIFHFFEFDFWFYFRGCVKLGK